MTNPYEADPDRIPPADLYADVPSYGRYYPKHDDFRIDSQHVNSQTTDSLRYWASVCASGQPFQGLAARYQYNTDTSPLAKDTGLVVQDGGETSQNIPLYPLIQKKREVDVIFAVDSLGSDSFEYNWPTGSALIATYNRTLLNVANDTSFPPVPDLDTFLNFGLNARPTFFGCNSSALSKSTPLVVYLLNHPITYSSNYTLEQSNFTNAARDDVITNGYNVATQANGTLDEDWSACVGCAVLSRSLDRTGTDVPEICTKCFQRYCWNGTVDNESPAPYTPTASLSASSVKATSSSTASSASTSLTTKGWSTLAMMGFVVYMVV
ncbi:lysophospholipase 1 [Penicillium verhagenii]|nr:lysophospholipase 1 [Penicillium verhagenii]